MILIAGITLTSLVGWLLNTFVLSGVTLNYMLMGVSFAAVFSNLATAAALSFILAKMFDSEKIVSGT